MLPKSTVSLPEEYLSRLQSSTRLPESFWDEFRARTLPDSNPFHLSLRESALVDLAAELELDPEKIARQEIDFRALAAHHSGNVMALPEPYAQGNSRVRTSAHLLDCAEAMFGWRARNQILRRLQVTESTLADLDLQISLRFLADVCMEMAALGVRNDQFSLLGMRTVVRNAKGTVAGLFRESRSVREMYEHCFNEIIQLHYDQNHIYRLVYSDHDRIILKAVPAPEVCDQLGTLWPGSAQVCANRAGGFASLPAYLGRRFANVQETRCIHRGDPACVFEITFDENIAAAAV